MVKCIALLISLGVNAYCAYPEPMLWPHRGPTATAVSSDGSALAMGGLDGNIRVFTFKGATVGMDSLNCGNRIASAVALSPDGKSLAAAGGRGWVTIFDAKRGIKTVELSLGKEKVSQLVYSEDGKMLAVVSGADILLLNSVTGKRLGAFRTRGVPLFALANSRKWMRYAASKSEVQAVSPELEKEIGRYEEMGRLWVPPGGKFAAFGSAPELKRSSDGKAQMLPGLPGQYAEQVAFFGDGIKMAVLRQYGDVQVWDLKSGTLTAAFNWRENNDMAHPDEAQFKISRGVYFVNGGRQLCIISEAGPAELWDVATGKKVRTLSPNTASIGSLRLVPGTRRLLSADWTGRVALWDLEKGELLNKWPSVTKGWPASLAVSGDGGAVFYGSDSMACGILRRMDDSIPAIEFGGRLERRQRQRTGKFQVLANPLKSGETLLVSAAEVRGGDMGAILKSAKRLEDAGGPPEYGVDVSPDKPLMAYGTRDGGIGLVDLETGAVRKLGGGGRTTWIVTYSVDGKYLAGIDVSGVVTIWETGGWTKQAELSGFTVQGIERTPFSRDGRYYIEPDRPETSKALMAKHISPDIRDTPRFKIRDTRTKKELMIDEPGEPVMSFSQDSSMLAALREEGGVKVWETGTGKSLAELKAPAAKQYSAEFMPGGKYLIVGGADGVIRVYALGSGEVIISLVEFMSGDWALSLPGGKYKGSNGVTRYLKMPGQRNKEELKSYESPAEVEAALSVLR